MRISRYKYYIGVGIFLALALASLAQAFAEGKTELVAILSAVIGYFAFMVVDRVEQAASIEKLEKTLQSLEAPINAMRADQLLAAAATDQTKQEIIRLSSTKSFDYICAKARAARRIYNTSFSADAAFVTGDYYGRWIDAILDAVTQHDCIVHEVMTSKRRLTMLKRAFHERGLPMSGSYVAIDLSSYSEKVNELPFIELCIFENDDDSVEVIFGWTSSNVDFLGADCFVSHDKHLAEYFLSYLRRFESLGKHVSLVERVPGDA